MRRLVFLLMIILLVTGGVGAYRGWFAVSGNREAVSHKIDLNLTVDSDKVKADAETVKEKAVELTGQATQDVDEPVKQTEGSSKSLDE
ncbi:MAG: hypothetical protein HQ518_20280 [Rhodopirellula sp.]|nr:hypothetical protein [Rhodopirellula sp.]